tara:strand:- start:102 stop:731 length:630 start_codon:yes stop_codon:yes gene_type:complete
MPQLPLLALPLVASSDPTLVASASKPYVSWRDYRSLHGTEPVLLPPGHPQPARWARQAYTASCFCPLAASGACVWASQQQTPQALWLSLLALWLVPQTALSYLGDVHEYLNQGQCGPWNAIDRVTASGTLIGCLLQLPNLRDPAPALCLTVASLVSWLGGVLLLRRSGPWSAEARPNLWAMCHSMWHVLATSAGVALAVGLRASRGSVS